MSETTEPGWRAYGGAADRYAAARAGLDRAKARLAEVLTQRDRDGSHPDPAEVATAWYQVGRAYTHALHVPPRERFEEALEAMSNAVAAGDGYGELADQARLWTGLGTAFKNLLAEPDDPASHHRHMEASLEAHAKGLALARQSSDASAVASALAGTALAYQYRDAGDRSANLESAAALLDEAIHLRLLHNQQVEAAIAATTCGIVWASHPDDAVGLPKAQTWYQRAKELLDAGAYPAHARRLGRSAGHAACRQSRWQAAAEAYAMAWRAVKQLVLQATEPADKRRELAEYGDSSARHVYALARQGQLQAAIRLADEYAATAVAITTANSQLSDHRHDVVLRIGGGANDLAARPPVAATQPPMPTPKQVGLCYLVPSHVGSVALLTSERNMSEADRPDWDASASAVLVRLDGIDSDWLKNEMAWPPIRAAHGPGVVSRLADEDSLEDRLLSPTLLRRLEKSLMGPVRRQAEQLGYAHLSFIPLGVLADTPLLAAWGLAAPDTTREPTTAGFAAQGLPGGTAKRQTIKPPQLDSASIAPSTRAARISTNLTYKPGDTHLVTVAVESSRSGPLTWTQIESQLIETLFPGSVTALRDGNATVARLEAELVNATHVHFAGHGGFAHADPLDTYLECEDGRVTLHDLTEGDRLKDATLFIASACSLGAADTFQTPDQALGLPSVLIERYGCALVAPIRPVYDLAAALFSIRLAELMWGANRYPPAQAAWRAQRWLANSTAAELIDWARPYPSLELETVLAVAEPQSTWNACPDVWASFSYFGR